MLVLFYGTYYIYVLFLFLYVLFYGTRILCVANIMKITHTKRGNGRESCQGDGEVMGELFAERGRGSSLPNSTCARAFSWTMRTWRSRLRGGIEAVRAGVGTLGRLGL